MRLRRKKAGDNVREQELELRRIVSLTPQMLMVMEPDGAIAWANKVVLDYLGISLPDLSAEDLRTRIFHPDDLQLLDEERENALVRGMPFEAEQRMRSKDGEYRWFLVRYKPLKDAEGRVVRWYGGATDIEARKRVEEVLRQREKELRETLDTIPAISFVTLPDGSGGIANRRWHEYTGLPQRVYGSVEAENEDWRDATGLYPEDLDGFLKVWNCSMATGEAFEYEARFRRSDGVYRWFLVRAVPLRDEQGKILRWYGIDTDIEDRKRAEEALQRREKELRNVINTIPAYIVSSLPDGRTEFINRQWQEFTGSSVEDTLASGYEDTIHPDDRTRFIADRRASLATGQPLKSEVRVRRADGEYRWWSTHTVPLRDELGNIVKWYGLATDIEDRKRAEEALRRSERELRDVVDTIPAMAFAILPDGSGFANRRWREYTGKSLRFKVPQPEDATWREYTGIHPEDFDEYMKSWLRASAAGEPFEHEARLRRADGEYRWFLVRIVPLRDEEGKILKWYGIDTDIEDRKRAEQELTRSETCLADAQKLTHTGSVVWDVRTKKALYLSDEWYRIFGFDTKLDQNAWKQGAQRVHPEDRAKWQSAVDRVVAEKSDYELEMRLVLPSGMTKYVRVTEHPVLNASGDVVQFIATVTDITERKRAEQERDRLRQMEEDLAHINRVSMMGELAASLAHELKQPIAATVTNANTCFRWLKRDIPDLDAACAATRRIVEDGRRAADIIDHLRSLYKKSPPQRELVEVNEIVREMAVLLRAEATRHSVSIRTDLAANLPRIMADRVQLQQVLMNLMLNGIEAMKETAGVLTVESQLDGDGRLLISVSDTGVGLPAEKEDQIFSAFFTTKAQGSGMGLAISRSIIESHYGRLWATDNSGCGATFYFTLPTAPR